MSQPMTLEDVWEILKETDRLIKEQAVENARREEEGRRWREEEARRREEETRQREEERKRREAETRQREEERKRREAEEAKQREEERKRREAEEAKQREEEARRREEEARRREEEARRLAEENRQREEERKRWEEESKRQELETRRALQEMSRKVGELGNRLGEFVEEMVKPNLVQLFQERGIAVYTLLRDIESRRPGAELQIDMLAVDSDTCVVVEVKSKLSAADVDEHLERMEKFKLALPVYREHRALGACAAMVIPDDVAKYAYRRGLFVLGQHGAAMRILNDARFQPKAW